MSLIKYQNIITHYIRWRKQHPDTWIDYTIEQPDILTVIKVAALSENKNGKRHNHQKRLKRDSIHDFIERLNRNAIKINEVKDFKTLLQIIESCKVKGIGDLACYDTANRIGRKIGVHPGKIYLHAETKQGAEKLTGNSIKKRFIEKSDLPEPFKSSKLSCAEIEDILCIYNARF